MPQPEAPETYRSPIHPLEALEGLEVARYRFTLELLGALQLPRFSGALLRGALGYALADLSPEAFRFLYGKGRVAGALHLEDARQRPMPFVLDVGEPRAPRRLDGGESISFDVVLFGAALDLTPLIICAVERVGERGLGAGRVPAELVRVDSVAADGSVMTVASATAGVVGRPSHGGEAGRSFVAAGAPSIGDSVVVQFRTWLRLKRDNVLCQSTPGFRYLLSRLIHRVDRLSQVFQGAPPMDGNAVRELLEAAESVETGDESLRWEDWDRPAAAGREPMKFGGLRGFVEYRGAIHPFMPWLQAGQWIHVGGKTSFGLGKYRLLSPSVD